MYFMYFISVIKNNISVHAWFMPLTRSSYSNSGSELWHVLLFKLLKKIVFSLKLLTLSSCWKTKLWNCDLKSIFNVERLVPKLLHVYSVPKNNIFCLHAVSLLLSYILVLCAAVLLTWWNIYPLCVQLCSKSSCLLIKEERALPVYYEVVVDGGELGAQLQLRLFVAQIHGCSES